MKNDRQIKITELVILGFGLILVLANRFFWPIKDLFSLIFLGITLLLFGLPHGSLDHLVEQKTNLKFNFTRFILLYLLQIAIVAICWIFFPISSLVFFLLLSAWHFAETDQIALISVNKINAVFITVIYGLSILGWILLSHSNETLVYISSLSSYFADRNLSLLLLNQQANIILCCGLLASGISAVLSYRNSNFMVIKTVLLLLITYYLPLITAFAFYFGLWHALHALTDIKNHLSVSWKILIIKAAPISIISISGLIFFLIFISRFHFNLILLTFIFISALTLPHARVMDGMYQKNSHKKSIGG